MFENQNGLGATQSFDLFDLSRGCQFIPVHLRDSLLLGQLLQKEISSFLKMILAK